MTKQQKISLICFIILFGFMAAVFVHYFKGMYLGLSYPHNTFLSAPHDKFNDFYGYYAIVQDRNPYFTSQLMNSCYFPFSNAFFYLFTLLPAFSSFVFFQAIFVVMLLFFTALSLRIEPKGLFFIAVLTITFFTYPFLISFDRANLENLVFVFLCLFALFYSRGKFLVSAFFLACAIGIKLYPAVFLILFISEKRYKAALWLVCFTVCLTAGALLFHKGGYWVNLKFVLSGFDFRNYPVHGEIVYGNNALVQRGVSLFTLLKVFFIETGRISSLAMHQFVRNYVWSAGLFFFALSGYIIFIEKELWRKVALLTAAMLLLPHISADYKLIHLYLPLVSFINATTRRKTDVFYAVFFGLLFIPKAYYFFPRVITDYNLHDLSIAVAINILLLLYMTVTIMITGSYEWIRNRRRLERAAY